MRNQSRELRDLVVSALARVGLVLALSLLGALFMSTAAQGDEPGGGYALSSFQSAGTATVQAGAAGGRAPSTAGLVLALVVVAAGICVLGYGAAHSGRRRVQDWADDQADERADDRADGVSPADPAPDDLSLR